jgi:hypothetical protein
MGSIGASDAESEGGRTGRWTPHKGRSSRRGERECEPPTPVGAGIGNEKWGEKKKRRKKDETMADHAPVLSPPRVDSLRRRAWVGLTASK